MIEYKLPHYNTHFNMGIFCPLIVHTFIIIGKGAGSVFRVNYHHMCVIVWQQLQRAVAFLQVRSFAIAAHFFICVKKEVIEMTKK